MKPDMREGEGMIIAFDFGERRIGVAVGHTDVGQASPTTVVKNVNGRPDWDHISQLVEEWQPVAFVVGLPVTEDNSEQPMLPLSNAFSKRLKNKYSRPVHRTDERYSSIEASRVIAENRQRGNRRKASRQDTDKIAAALILEQWFSDQSESGAI